ncbi:MAG: DUF4254 domain-containing protein [Bacteroidota bacterium]|nr:DUF4254 domain-containing protein [Bacteroidota bacterium]
MLQASEAIKIFIQSITDWHKNLSPASNPFPEHSAAYLLYKKNHIDTIQWHEEDEIRRPDLPDQDLVRIKRNIDKLNQERTDTVELLDDLVHSEFKDVKQSSNARMNSETPAWLLDRMSILELKIYHMEEQTLRTNVDQAHIDKCKNKLAILLEQRTDMSTCFDQLIDEISKGTRYFRVYRQMKMYNSQELNPSLYSNANS